MIIPLIILSTILLIICLATIVYWYRMPVQSSDNSECSTSSDNSESSTITHNEIGLRGDMGNQMFQIAALIGAQGQRAQGQPKIVLPTRISSLSIAELFDLSQFEQADIPIHHTFYEQDNYNKILVPSNGKNYNVRGYRQCYKYFDQVSDKVRSVFTPRQNILDAVKKVMPTEYIAVHIRRGDYIKKIHKIPLLREFRRCQLPYYQKAIKELRIKYPDCPVLVCTDSPKIVKDMLSLLDEKAILAPIAKGVNPKFNDFCVMYLADAVVMSNSTYSWMACYLKSGREIIAPSPWWDPSGFIGTSMGLHGPYLHYPDWKLLNCDTGDSETSPPDVDNQTFKIFKVMRGFLV